MWIHGSGLGRWLDWIALTIGMASTRMISESMGSGKPWLMWSIERHTATDALKSTEEVGIGPRADDVTPTELLYEQVAHLLTAFDIIIGRKADDRDRAC